MVIFTGLEGRVNELMGTSTKRQYTTEPRNTLTEMKSTLEGINNPLADAEEWIRDLEQDKGKPPS